MKDTVNVHSLKHELIQGLSSLENIVVIENLIDLKRQEICEG